MGPPERLRGKGTNLLCESDFSVRRIKAFAGQFLSCWGLGSIMLLRAWSPAVGPCGFGRIWKAGVHIPGRLLCWTGLFSVTLHSKHWLTFLRPRDVPPSCWASAAPPAVNRSSLMLPAEVSPVIPYQPLEVWKQHGESWGKCPCVLYFTLCSRHILPSGWNENFRGRFFFFFIIFAISFF